MDTARDPNVQGGLAGLRVLDLTQNVAGPFCTQILGDMGAEIIKIERPAAGDDTRSWAPVAWGARSSTFLALNRNKKSVALDLDSEKGLSILKQLVRDADVLVHSLKPGSAQARGFGFDQLAQINPRLIYASISAFGSKGPLCKLPGYDPLMQAYTGIMSVTGSEGDAPARVSVSLIDMGSGMWAAMGILAALREVERTGRGTTVDASLLETGVAWMSILIANYQATGNLPKRMGSAMAMTAPYEIFQAKDGAVFIAAGNDRLFAKVCDALGLQVLLDDPRFVTNAERVKNRQALREMMESRTRELQAAQIEALLQAKGAPCSVMNNIKQLLDSQQVAAVGIVQSLPIEPGDAHKVVGLPFTLGGTRRETHTAPPDLGQHTAETLLGAGYSKDQIDDLLRSGVIR